MYRIKYSVAMFALMTGVTTAASIVVDRVTLFDIWIVPIGAVILFIALETPEERVETFEAFKSASPWAFTVLLFSFSLLVTYREIGAESISVDVGWMMIPGIAVAILFLPTGGRLQLGLPK